MKNINMPLEDERHADLCFLQEYYSKQLGIKLSKIAVIKKVLFESANRAKHEQKYGKGVSGV